MSFLKVCHAIKKMCVKAARPELWESKCSLSYHEITVEKVNKGLK